MRKYTLIFVSFIVFSFLSCDSDDTISLKYKQTGCADKWGSSNLPDSLTILNAQNYLEDKGIEVREIKIFVDTLPEDCFSCGCLSGKIIECKISESDVNAILTEGFYQ